MSELKWLPGSEGSERRAAFEHNQRVALAEIRGIKPWDERRSGESLRSVEHASLSRETARTDREPAGAPGRLQSKRGGGPIAKECDGRFREPELGSPGYREQPYCLECDRILENGTRERVCQICGAYAVTPDPTPAVDRSWCLD